jgi:23S rRNA (guanosine2251-2'-O)-methyltransferase
MKFEVLYGIHPVTEALRAKRRDVETVFIAEAGKPGRLQALLKAARQAGLPVRKLDGERLEQLSGSRHHQGVAARVSPFPVAAIRSVAELVSSPDHPALYLLLDQMLDPQNLGAIIRSALSVGVDAVVIPKKRSASPTPAVSRASAGALEHMRLIRVTNMAEAMQAFKKGGLWLYGLDRSAPVDLYRTRFPESLGLVIGGEGSGLRPLVKARCDQLLSIPQQGPLDSLNASAAAAVALYEVYRQRRYPNGHG